MENTKNVFEKKNLSNLVKRKKTHSVLGAPNKNFTCLSIDFSKSISSFLSSIPCPHQSLDLHQVQGKILPSPAPGNRDCRCFCISPQTPSAPRWSSLRAPESVLWGMFSRHCSHGTLHIHVAICCTYLHIYDIFIRILYIYDGLNLYYINYILQIRSQSHQWRKGTGFVDYIYQISFSAWGVFAPNPLTWSPSVLGWPAPCQASCRVRTRAFKMLTKSYFQEQVLQEDCYPVLTV